MKDQFVPYELALKLKELGFDEECLGAFDGEKEFEVIEPINGEFICKNSWYFKNGDCVAAPLWQQAGNFLYLRSNNKINFQINGNDNYESLSKKLEQAIKNFRNL